MAITELACAKINLTLSVLGRRPDGYHEIESLVTFAELADRVTLTPAQAAAPSVHGPFAASIVGENILSRALVALRPIAGALVLGHVEVEKNIPVAAGLGGGSADAAALLRAAKRASADPAPNDAWERAALGLGADVPVCFTGVPAVVRGVGERITPVLDLPTIAAVLANPGRGLATSEVFSTFEAQHSSRRRFRLATDTQIRDLQELIDVMREHGNDLERAASALLPQIADVKAALASLSGCRIAAMSGSGPTCFGLFANDEEAARAAQLLSEQAPAWWVAPTWFAGTQPVPRPSWRG